MKFLDEYRDAAGVQKLAAAVARKVTRPWTVMEVCGGQTHAIVKYGIDALLPAEISETERVGSLAGLGWRRLDAGDFDHSPTLQPLYLRRPSITVSRRKR